MSKHFHDAFNVLNATCNESLLPPTREVVSDSIRHVALREQNNKKQSTVKSGWTY